MQSTADAPRRRRQVDVDGQREVVADEQLGPLPGGPLGQTDPPRRLRPEQGGLDPAVAERDGRAVQRDVDRRLPAFEGHQSLERVGPADGEPGAVDAPSHTQPLAGAGGGGELDVETDIGRPFEHAGEIKPGGNNP